MNGYVVNEIKVPCKKCKIGSLRMHVNNEGLYIKCGNCGYIEESSALNTAKNKFTLKEDLEGLLEEQVKLSKALFPNEDSNTYDGDVIYDEGRGQGIYETCIKIREFLKEY